MAGSTQRPPQATCPAGQLVAQSPAVHTSPATQVSPAFAPAQSPVAPQKVGSVAGSTQRPPQST